MRFNDREIAIATLFFILSQSNSNGVRISMNESTPFNIYIYTYILSESIEFNVLLSKQGCRWNVSFTKKIWDNIMNRMASNNVLFNVNLA